MMSFSLKSPRCISPFKGGAVHRLNLRRFSSNESTTSAKKGVKTSNLIAAGSLVAGVGTCIYARHYRQQKLQELDWNCFSERNLDELVDIMERNGLMGVTDSVKDELDYIQAWHTEHGYRGGLTLRDLTQHLFVDKEFGIVEQFEDPIVDPMHLARRECYYMYYEIKGNGQIRQQIFCRGTTLSVEILTCLSFWMVHDEDLDCRVHAGFRNHADRILKDILPLLPPAEDKRTTVEVSGHSLGGAVAFILAAKLRKRGFNVVRVTSMGAPRFCATASGARSVLTMLPENTLRIENDADIITYLPPFCHNVGDKLYLLNETRDVAYIPTSSATKWADNVFVNFRLPELLWAGGQPHRVYAYVSRFKEAFGKSSRIEKDRTDEVQDLCVSEGES
jgi:hypothetical protein